MPVKNSYYIYAVKAWIGYYREWECLRRAKTNNAAVAA